MKTMIWEGHTADFKALQESLRAGIDLEPLQDQPRLIAGADISLNRGSRTVYAGIVVLDYQTLEMVEQQGVIEDVDVPYIPGYLSFREVPPLYKAWQKLLCRPDVVMLDGHGILHPRAMGVATHFGLTAKVATLGCAKKPLVGEFSEPAYTAGSAEPVNYQSETRGYILRTRRNVKPVFISPGTGMNCTDALQIAQHCARGWRLPEPTRQAHLYVNHLRRMQLQGE